MKTLIETDSMIEKILGKQGYEEDTSYRLLSWCGYIDGEEERLLHNYMTGKTLIMEPGEDHYTKELKPGLIADWFLVPKDSDDVQLLEELRSAMKLFDNKKGINSYKILTTTDCNARCFYCYEAGIKKENMSRETAEKTVEFIEKNSRGDGEVTLAWFGGEPMMNTEVMDIICNGLNNRSIRYASVMTSNGYLFDDEKTEKSVRDWNLKNIQITLDGTKEVYNNIKAYTDAESDPYERVLRNIQNLADAGVRVNIRLNMVAGNFDDTLKLIDELSDRFMENKNVSVYVSGLFQELEKDDVSLKKDLSEKLIMAAKKISDAGLDRPKKKNIHTRTGGCMADNDNHIGISPAGKLMKCEHFIFDRLVGDIDLGKDDELSQRWKKRMPEGEMCAKCTVRPVCYRLDGCPVSHPCDEFEQKEFMLRKESQILKNQELINRNDIKNEELTAFSGDEIC